MKKVILLGVMIAISCSLSAYAKQAIENGTGPLGIVKGSEELGTGPLDSLGSHSQA